MDHGFISSSFLEFIKEVRRLLTDQYPWDGQSVTIIKELVQNANDAGATKLHLGSSPGLGDAARHPLLKFPALFVLNDGRFKSEDAYNITRLGSNSKTGEALTVGLRLTSVLHGECERL